jgi:heme/copper-type cytochrome/quinol oxidase subunit 2
MLQLAALLAADVAEEGKNIVLSMLVVGLIFIGVIALGQFISWLGHRR